MSDRAPTPQREAAAAQNSLGIAAHPLLETSCYAVSVTQTKTANILFQFDGGDACPLRQARAFQVPINRVTWFKGFRYYGAFRSMSVLDGGNLTVVNMVASGRLC
jgi:stage II sporulation protein D